MMRLSTLLGATAVAGMLALGGCAARQPAVTQYGEMHEVLGGGAESATALVSVGDLIREPGVVAVGAAERLDGEITIYDGTALLSRGRTEGLRTTVLEADTNLGAAFLTTAKVDAWQEVAIDRDLDPPAFEEFLASVAQANRLDLSKPFPFVVQGDVSGFRAHVIQGACPMRPGAVLAEQQKPWVYEPADAVAATIVGFRAADSVGKLTHPGTTLHAHAILEVDGKKVTGHVERMSIRRGTTLRIPKVG